MDLFKQNKGMKGPARPAPAVPTMGVNRYSPVTNWNDDPFGADVFEPMPQCNQKKLPPPRPPPPKINNNPDVPVKPSHFIRKPTVLSTLLYRRNNTKAPSNNAANTQNLHLDLGSEVDANRMFPKCEPKNLQTGTLIDLSSPPSSPTFTTRSSSDGLSVDSFGSDATTSTNHNNMMNGGNASQAESGFEDDFDLFLTTRKPMAKDDTLDDFAAVDPFSPQIITKPPIMKKPVLNRDLFELSSNSTIQPPVSALKGPTIIRAKPARPKPPDNSALLKNTFGSNFPVIPMNVNTTKTPIQKVCNGFGDSFDSKLPSWDDQPSPEREASPPMPAGPPPPPPPAVDDVPDWQNDEQDEQDEPYAIALYDYFTDHEDDLSFSAQSKITLLRRVDDEWFFGRARSGAEGLFPASYVEVRIAPPVSTPVTAVPPVPAPRAVSVSIATATALYDFPGVEAADLPFSAGDRIAVLNHVSAEWAYGECRGRRGQFPLNYVQTD